MAKIFYLVFFTASISAQNQDLPSLLNDLANELIRDIEALWDEDIRIITIFSDFDKATDRFFFQAVLPWIVDNIGNDLRINYRFRNSGRSAGPRMCGLRSLRANTYTQAEFLKCEAQGNPISTCVDQAPINRRTYNRCINTRVNDYVRTSQWDFDTLVSDQTPVIRMNGRKELNSANPVRLFRMICQAYGRIKPIGCLRPTALVPQPRNADSNFPSSVSPNSAFLNPVLPDITSSILPNIASPVNPTNSNVVLPERTTSTSSNSASVVIPTTSNDELPDRTSSVLPNSASIVPNTVPDSSSSILPNSASTDIPTAA